MSDVPSQHLDLVLQRVLFALQRLLVDDLDGEQLAGVLATVRQPHLGEGAAVRNGMVNVSIWQTITFRRGSQSTRVDLSIYR